MLSTVKEKISPLRWLGATVMALTSLTSDNKSLVQENLYQVALTAGKAIWALPFLVTLVVAVVVVSPLWLGEKIALRLKAKGNCSGKRF